MQKILLFSLLCTGCLVSAPVRATVVHRQQISQIFAGERYWQLAQFHRHQERRYLVYYRNKNGLVWIFAGFYLNRRDAERAARRLEWRGYRTDIRLRVREAEDSRGSGDWDRR
jgi:hypothetical protein